MRVWWSKGPAPGNFGDILTPYLLAHFGIDCTWASLGECEAISTGSIVRFARDGVMVLGSGLIDSRDVVNPRADYRWVRGPLTREAVIRAGGECQAVYGDPAMLLPQVFPRDVEAEVEVGVFAHYVDLEHCKRYPVVINPLERPMEVLRKVWRCKRIVSSSLHGIIAAHAYGIPAAWVKFGGKLTGDDVKFHDHALAVGLPQMPLSTVDDPEFTLPVFTDKISEVLRGIGH